MPAEPITSKQSNTTPEFDIAVVCANRAVDELWNAADGLTTGQLIGAFISLREKIDHYIQEIGH